MTQPYLSHEQIVYAVFEALARYRDELPDAVRKVYPFFVGKTHTGVVVFGGQDQPSWLVEVRRP